MTTWKKRLAQAFIFILLTQAVGTMADVHSSHQSGTEHLTFNHSHNHDSQDSENHLDNTHGAEYDCHHCCHCHGVHHHWIAANLVIESAHSYKQSYLIQFYFLPPSPHENLLRPPIRSLVI